MTGYVYDFSVDYRAVSTVTIPNIHKYLIIKNDMGKRESV